MNQQITDFINHSRYESSALQIVKVKPDFDINAKNIEITKVYNGITKDLRQILSKLTHPEARTYMVTFNPHQFEPTPHIVHEFVCIMCTLTLSIYKDYRLIELDTDYEIKRWIGAHNYDQMLRAAYRATMWETTQYNIEDCLQVNTEKVDHYDYFVKRLMAGENYDASIFVEPALNFFDDEPI